MISVIDEEESKPVSESGLSKGSEMDAILRLPQALEKSLRQILDRSIVNPDERFETFLVRKQR